MYDYLKRIFYYLSSVSISLTTNILQNIFLIKRALFVSIKCLHDVKNPNF